MSEYGALEQWLINNTIVVLLLISLLFAGLVKLSLMVWDQHKQLEKSEITRLVEQIQDLVEQIKFLFKHQDNQNEQLEAIKGRVGNLEKKVGQQNALCREREKMLFDVKAKQDTSIAKYDKALIDRAGQARAVNRMDRET